MLIFQKIVIMCSMPPVAIAEQNIFASRTPGQYRYVIEGVVKSFFIPHKITAFSPEDAGSEKYNK